MPHRFRIEHARLRARQNVVNLLIDPSNGNARITRSYASQRTRQGARDLLSLLTPVEVSGKSDLSTNSRKLMNNPSSHGSGTPNSAQRGTPLLYPKDGANDVPTRIVRTRAITLPRLILI
jgi:hypothetical protein